MVSHPAAPTPVVFLAAQCFSLNPNSTPQQTSGLGYWIFNINLLLDTQPGGTPNT
jgi:hypothetical protein